MRITGIDTGAKGCAFTICSDTHKYMHHYRFSSDEIGYIECGSKGYSKTNLVSIDDIEQALRDANPDWIIIEEVKGIEGKNTKGTLLSQGFNYYACLVAAKRVLPEDRIRLAHSLTWKRSLGLTTRRGTTQKAKKEKTYKYVSQKIPEKVFTGPQGGIYDGVSDAAAIAIYGYQYLKANGKIP